MMVASGEWARWRGPQEKEYRGGAHRRKIPSSGRGGARLVVLLVSRQPHARTRPPLPGPAGARPCRPTVVARAAVVLSPRTSASPTSPAAPADSPSARPRWTGRVQAHMVRFEAWTSMAKSRTSMPRETWVPLVLQQPPDEKPFRYVCSASQVRLLSSS